MKQYNHTIYAVLGILTTDCRSGYAIKQMIDQSLNHFWKVSYGQIYPALKLIVEEGLANVYTNADDARPGKNEYELTAKGKEVLKEWLERPIEQIPVERNELLLKLFFGRHQLNENMIVQVEEYRKKLETRLATYESIEQSILPNKDREADARYWLFTLDYGKRVTRAAIDWCDSVIAQLEKEE